MSGTARHLLGAAIVVVVLLTVGGAIFWWSVRGPLAGETYHDFGQVAIAGRTATVEHVFELTNRTGGTLEIVEVVPSCGCTSVDVSRETLEPGEQVDLTIALTLGNGTRKKSVTLVLDDGQRERTQLVWVKGTGAATRTLSATRTSLPLAGDGWSRLTVRHDTLDEASPPLPLLEAPAGIEAVFDGWERREGSTNPVRWTGTLKVRPSAADPPLPASLTLQLGRQKLVIELTPDRQPPTPNPSS